MIKSHWLTMSESEMRGRFSMSRFDLDIWRLRDHVSRGYKYYSILRIDNNLIIIIDVMINEFLLFQSMMNFSYIMKIIELLNWDIKEYIYRIEINISLIILRHNRFISECVFCHDRFFEFLSMWYNEWSKNSFLL